MTAFGQDVGAGASPPHVAGDHLELNVTDVDGAGNPVDLTTASSIRWGLFQRGAGNAPRGSVVLEKTLGGGITITDGPAGKFVVTISSGDTGSLSGALYHEAEIIDAGGRVSTILRGQFSVAAEGLEPAP